MVTISPTQRVSGRRSLRAGALLFLAAYALLQASGLFGPPSPGIIRTAHRWPALCAIAAIVAVSAAELHAALKGSGGLSLRSLPQVLLHCGLLIAGLGLVVSSLTRFEVNLTLAEGQEAYAGRDGLDPAAVYARTFSPWPDETIAVREVHPFFSEKGRPRYEKNALVRFTRRGGTGGREQLLSSLIPHMIGRFFYQISDVGYAPHFQLFDGDRRLIEEAYVVMNLYPPGSEDLFRVNEVPHTFSLRYYPDASLISGKDARAAGKTGPLYKLRIGRNLGLIVNDYASPYEYLPVDALTLSLQDVKPWVEVRIVSDAGLFLIVPGALLAAAGGLVAAAGAVRNRRKERHAGGNIS
jgi:hypothetical protein